MSELESYNAFVESSGSELSRDTGCKASNVPRVLPCQALDHASGYLLAFGILAAKCRSILESGNGENGWQVQVSLAGVESWLESLGRLHGAQAWQEPDEIDDNGKEVQDLLEAYTVRWPTESLTLYSLQHSASPLPSHDKSVPCHLDIDIPKWAQYDDDDLPKVDQFLYSTLLRNAR